MLLQFPMESMNSGKGVPCRALEILTFMYNCSNGGPALPPSCEKRKRKKKFGDVFSLVTFSQGVRVIFFKERKPSPLFSFHRLQSQPLNVIHLKLFREQASMQSLNHVRDQKGKRNYYCSN